MSSSTWKTHIWNSTDKPPKPGNIMAACGKVIPSVIPMTGELHESLHVCQTCLSVGSLDMPADSKRRYFTFLIPTTRFKTEAEPVIVRSREGEE